MTVQLQDGASPEWTCHICGDDWLWCGCKNMKVNQATQGPPTIGGLRGIILREERDTLVVQASGEDIKRFAAKQGSEVTMARMSMDYATAMRAAQYGEVPAVLPVQPYALLYNEYGRPVARVVEVDYHSDNLETTTFGDTSRTYARGLTRYSIRAEGIIP